MNNNEKINKILEEISKVSIEIEKKLVDAENEFNCIQRADKRNTERKKENDVLVDDCGKRVSKGITFNTISVIFFVFITLIPMPITVIFWFLFISFYGITVFNNKDLNLFLSLCDLAKLQSRIALESNQHHKELLKHSNMLEHYNNQKKDLSNHKQDLLNLYKEYLLIGTDEMSIKNEVVKAPEIKSYQFVKKI